MIKNSQNQAGSAHIVIIVILVVAIMGVLGFVVWNNFSTPKDEASNSSEQADANEGPKAVAKTYKNDAYEFQYPKEDWALTEEYYDTEDTNKVTPVLKTSNWEQTGMGLDAGAQVAVTANTTTKSLAAMKEDIASFAGGIAKDLKDTRVDGVEAFSYNMAYEGERYHTVFIKDGVAYDITYQYAENVEPRFYFDAYEMVVVTFKFK